MKLKHIFAVLGVSLFSFFTQAKSPSPQVIIRTDLASPVVLADKLESNYLKISLTGVERDNIKRVPINLALVIDRSGSMYGDRIDKAKAAAIMAINSLNENDIVSVIAYDDNAKIIIPATKVTDKKKLISIIKNEIEADGTTALFAGLTKGINEVSKYLDKEKVNRVILLSDGQANVGPTSVSELSDVAIVAAKKGIAITTIGLGSDYNELLMAAIARNSDGNHAFVENSADLEKVFVKEFKDVMSVIAQELIVTITLQDGVKPVQLLGRTGSIDGNVVQVKMNQLYSNQEQYVLLEIIPEQGNIDEKKTLANISVNYDDLSNNQAENYKETVTIRYTAKIDEVKTSQVEDVIAESVIQKVTLENEKAIELYNSGKIVEAKELMKDNREKLQILNQTISQPEVSQRIGFQASKNQIMADAIESDNSDVYLKKVTEMQFDSMQSTIKLKSEE